MRPLLVAHQLRRRVPDGITTYARELARHVPGATVWVGRARRGGADPLAAELASTGASAAPAVVSSPLPSRALVWAWDRGRAAPPAGFDVVHATSLAVPPRGDGPLAVTVHDLAWRRLPETFPPRGRRWHEAALGRALARADQFVTPSAQTADDLVAAGAPIARVEVIAEGCDHLPAPDAAGAAAFLARVGVDPGAPYLLTVSTLEPRKNLPRLVAAHHAAQPRLPAPCPLVVVGASGWGPALAPSPGVALGGPAGGGVVAGLLAGARAFVSVPMFEGFGLPAVEAMAAGVPVVASPQPSLGGAALEVDPSDVDAIAGGLVRALTDEALRADLVAAGRAHASALSWAATGARHVEVWQSLVGVRGR